MGVKWACDLSTGICSAHAAGDTVRGLLLLAGLVAFWLGLATAKALR